MEPKSFRGMMRQIRRFQLRNKQVPKWLIDKYEDTRLADPTGTRYPSVYSLITGFRHPTKPVTLQNISQKDKAKAATKARLLKGAELEQRKRELQGDHH